MGRELKKLGYVKLTALPRHHAQNELAMEAFKKGTLQPSWQMSEQQARHVMRASDPAQISEANRIARERDMPATLVESDLATFRDQEKIDRLRALSTRYPAIGRFASDGRAATIVADDSEALGRIAASMEAWRTRNPYSLRDTKPPEASLGSLVRGVYESFRTGAAGLRAQIEDAVPRPPFISKEAWEYSERQSLKRVEGAVGRQADAQPEFQSSTASGLYSGVSSIAQMAPGIAASIATRSPAPAVSSAALLTQTQAYAKYRARGASKGEAFTGATGEGVVEAIGELIPMGVVVKRFGAPCVIMPHVPHEIGRGFDPEADFMPIVERQWEIEDWPVGESGRGVAGEIVLTSVSADGIDHKVLHDYGAFGCATTRRFWERLLAA